MPIDFIQASLLKGIEIRADLLKWKLITVGSIGAIGIGGKDAAAQAPFVLVLIPIICAYVDLIYRNSCLRRNRLRAFVIRNKGNRVYSSLAALLQVEHERAMENIKGFSFESGAAFLSSVFLSLAVAAYPLISGQQDKARSVFFIAGLIGIILALITELNYGRLNKENEVTNL